ncbi:MAG: M66 family metalloprotease [Meiothermus sp.]|uniref:M66 family metalloprotease n=1 Tax=Meiothermus sp. TaxID=1955249 RepID=UPI0026011935|nr:M66 family metalloprotease [Meiothermus sp.]MCS7068141.1 M66 family metalloprotease [Meiothermus sp.]MDW8424571.1 M66 family metalloprotease [Meiothermus sp.]
MRAWLVLALGLMAACNPSPEISGPEVPAAFGEVTIQKTEWGQSVLKAQLRLVAGKPALLRVFLTGDREGLPGSLEGEVFQGNSWLGELSFTGPATLPTAPAEPAPAYRATLPAAWVVPGMQVRLLADPRNQVGEGNEADNRLTLTPAVGVGAVLPLTLVPVLQPGQASPPLLPGVDLLRDMLPVREVQVVTRPPFAYGATVANASSDWSSLLSALRGLRTSDGSSRYYYGVVRVGYSSGIAGIGYVGLPVSVGWDFESSAARVMAHEIGHNLGREHAPCKVAGEPGYPYAGGSIGTWGYSLASGELFNPASHKDIMSYCTPQWISDYTYSGMQSFLEARPPSSQSQNQGPAQEVLLISGRIRNGELRLNPLVRLWAAPEPPRPGEYRLRLEAAGGPLEVSFQAEPVEAPHGPEQPPEASWSEAHFSFSLPYPGPLRGLEISQAGRALFGQTVEPRLYPQGTVQVGLLEHDGKVTLSWASTAYPYASLAHLGPERTTLGLWLTGGEASLPARGLPAGGRWEVALSDGFNTQRLELPR